MSSPETSPNPTPSRWAEALRATIKGVGALVLMAAISGAAAYGVFEWRIQQEQASTAAQVTALREELAKQQGDLQQRQEALNQQMARVEKAAEEAKLLLAEEGNVTSLDAKLKEIDTIKLDLQKTREELDAKFQAMEKTVVDRIAQQGQETAQALSLELQWKSLVIKAQGEVLLTQVYYAEGNRGLAKDELNIAANSLQEALAIAPEAVRPQIKQVVDLAEQAKGAVIMEQSSARDSINLLWHRVSELLAPPKQ